MCIHIQYICIHIQHIVWHPVPRLSLSLQLAVIFTDECDKFKDLTHAHSFAHDFHLRTIQQYLSKHQPPRFMHGYNLTSFLHDFSQHFSYAPSFAQNLIYEGRSMCEWCDFSQHFLGLWVNFVTSVTVARSMCQWCDFSQHFLGMCVSSVNSANTS